MKEEAEKTETTQLKALRMLLLITGSNTGLLPFSQVLVAASWLNDRR